MSAPMTFVAKRSCGCVIGLASDRMLRGPVFVSSVLRPEDDLALWLGRRILQGATIERRPSSETLGWKVDICTEEDSCPGPQAAASA